VLKLPTADIMIFQAFIILSRIKTLFNFSDLHLNIASMAQHFDEFDGFLAQVNLSFGVIGISESRFLKNRDPVTL